MSIASIVADNPANALVAKSPHGGDHPKFHIKMHESRCVRFEDELPQGPQRVDLQTALADFKAEASKTPAQRCRDEVMKEWHVTKESLVAMPPEQAKQMEARISAEVARRMGAHRAAEQGDPADVAAGSDDPGAPSTLEVLSARIVPTSIASAV